MLSDAHCYVTKIMIYPCSLDALNHYTIWLRSLSVKTTYQMQVFLIDYN